MNKSNKNTKVESVSKPSTPKSSNSETVPKIRNKPGPKPGTPRKPKVQINPGIQGINSSYDKYARIPKNTPGLQRLVETLHKRLSETQNRGLGAIDALRALLEIIKQYRG